MGNVELYLTKSLRINDMKINASGLWCSPIAMKLGGLKFIVDKSALDTLMASSEVKIIIFHSLRLK
jgi:hypothetical protein